MTAVVRICKGESPWNTASRRWDTPVQFLPGQPIVGLALSGGFARGIAHIGVLRVLERHHIPISMIAGVSAGSIAAAAWAGGVSAGEIEAIACKMSLKQVARWSLSRLGLASSDRMTGFLRRVLKVHTFEDMPIPLAIAATDVMTGEPVVFCGPGDVTLPIRASCAYPGLFQPIEYQGRWLVDGAMTMEVPAYPLRLMGATHVIAVTVPPQRVVSNPKNLFSIVNCCFQILHSRTEHQWRCYSDLVIRPEVDTFTWDSFESAVAMIEAGEQAALAALPTIRSWLEETTTRTPNPLRLITEANLAA